MHYYQGVWCNCTLTINESFQSHLHTMIFIVPLLPLFFFWLLFFFLFLFPPFLCCITSRCSCKMGSIFCFLTIIVTTLWKSINSKMHRYSNKMMKEDLICQRWTISQVHLSCSMLGSDWKLQWYRTASRGLCTCRSPLSHQILSREKATMHKKTCDFSLLLTATATR